MLAKLIEALKRRHPDAEFFGCAGPRMQAAGVRAVVDQRSLAVVGIVEVVGHLPRIWGEFQKLVRSAAAERPDLAILTDSPDFHLRLAKKLKKLGIPVVYLIAPQAWAWRPGRAARIAQVADDPFQFTDAVLGLLQFLQRALEARRTGSRPSSAHGGETGPRRSQSR